MIQRFLATLVCAFALNFGAAAAQTSDDPLCALAPFQMLAALDGTWSLTQEAGVAIGAGRRIPLPPNTQSFTIEFDPTIGIADLKGGSPPQSLALIPTNPAAVEEIIWFTFDVDESGEEQNLLETQLNIGTSCDFYDLPLVLGFNTYSLTQPAEQGDSYAIFSVVGDNIVGFCIPLEVASELDIAQFELEFVTQGADVGGDDATICGPVTVPNPDPGTMVMSLAMKFHRANHGTGILQFEGEQGGHSFFATAPVTMSR